MATADELRTLRPTFLTDPSSAYRLVESAEGGSQQDRPGDLFIQAATGAHADAIGWGAWAAISGYSPASSYQAVEIVGMAGFSPPGSSGGYSVPVLSQYQTGVMKTRFSGWAVLVGTPYYDIPPYPESMDYVRADLYGYEVTFDALPRLEGGWVMELYKHILTSGGGEIPEPETLICPPRPPWPYVDPVPVPPRISSKSGRVRRSNP